MTADVATAAAAAAMADAAVGSAVFCFASASVTCALAALAATVPPSVRPLAFAVAGSGVAVTFAVTGDAGLASSPRPLLGRFRLAGSGVTVGRGVGDRRISLDGGWRSVLSLDEDESHERRSEDRRSHEDRRPPSALATPRPDGHHDPSIVARPPTRPAIRQHSPIATPRRYVERVVERHGGHFAP